MSYDTARPHIASYLVFRNRGKVAFVLRANTAWMNGRYSLVAGKVEKNESYIQAAIREAKEEAGVDIKARDLRVVHVCHRWEPSKQADDWVDVYFEATKWEGKLYNAEPESHSQLDWLDPKNLPKNVVRSVKFVIEKIEAGERYSEYGWDN